MRIQSLILGTAASLLVVAMGAIASIVSHLSGSSVDRAGERAVPVAVAARRLDRSCADCGVVVAVRPIELRASTSTLRYQIHVRMSDGSVKTLTSSSQPAWKAGDRVRLQNGRLVG